MRRTVVFYIMMFLTLPFSIVKAAELPVIDPLVSVSKALEFGVWKVYNEGSDILILDQESVRLIEVDVDHITVDNGRESFLLLDRGDTSVFPSSTSYQKDKAEIRNAGTNGQMLNARYQFGNRVFVVNGNTMTIFYVTDVDSSGVIITKTEINKFTNGVVHTGPQNQTILEATFTVMPPSSGSLVAINPAHTGSWFDPATSGRGGFVNIAEQNGQQVFVVSWFDYNDDGSQMWLLGSVPFEVGSTRIVVPMQITEKNANGEVIRSDWGSFTFEFTSCNFGNLLIEPNSGAPTQALSLSRLTKISGLSC